MATISFNTTFNLPSGVFIFDDTSDWAGQGIALADVNGSFKIVSPSGVTVYNNTSYTTVDCDIYIDNSLQSQQTISLPTNGAGEVEQGEYTITYTVYDSNLAQYYTQVNTYTFEFTAPTVEITQTIDCISPLFTSVDSTNYTVNSVAPTISRSHEIYYPAGSAGYGTPVSGSTATLTTGTFYSGTQTTVISTTATWTFSDDLIVVDILEGSKEVVVDCTWVCSIYCCIKALEARMIGYETTDSVKYAKEKALFSQVMGLVGLAKLAIECGKSDDVEAYLDVIYRLTECNEDCSCEGDEPALVTGIGGLVNNVVVQAGSANVTVTASTVGNTTTYTVNLGAAFVALVNSLYNTALTAGDNVTITSATVGLTTTYTVNSKEAIVAAGANMSVTPVTVNYDTTYTIATNISTQEVEETTAKALSVGNNEIMDSDLTVATTGAYLVLFEADVDNNLENANIEFEYSIMKNGAYASISNVRQYFLKFTAADKLISKIIIYDFISLTAADAVNVWGNVTSWAANARIDGRSLRIVRLA